MSAAPALIAQNGDSLREAFGKALSGMADEFSNVVVLDPEIADLFPNSASVNTALRALAEIARRSGSTPRKSQ